MSEVVVNTIRDFLTKMELNFSYEEEEKKFILPYEFSGKDFVVNVFVGEKWIMIGVLLAKAEELPANLNKEVFYARLLRDTFYISEVAFGLTNSGDVVVHAETYVDALTFENFRIEFGSVVYGIKHFIENIMKDFPVKISEAARLYV